MLALAAAAGGSFAADASVATVYNSDAGSGLAAGSDGGVTIGSAAAFNSNFVYMANANEGTVSRILIPGDGGTPFEEARYFSIVPVDNHGVEPCYGPLGCYQIAGVTQTDIWHYQYLSYVVNPFYNLTFCYADGGYSVPTTLPEADGGYTLTTFVPFNDGGYSVTVVTPYDDGGYSVRGDAGYFNDGGYSAVGDAGYFNDGGYTITVSTPYNDGGYSLIGDAGYFNDGGYNQTVVTPYNDGGYDKTADAGYFADGGYNVSVTTPYNDGGYNKVADAGYFADAGYTRSVTTPYNDGGSTAVVTVPEHDGGYSEVITFYDGGAIWHPDGGGTLTDGGEYVATVYFDDAGYSTDASLNFSDGGYNVTVVTPYNDAGYDLTSTQPFNDGGYNITVVTPYNDAGYDLHSTQPFNDGGYNVSVTTPYNDGGYDLHASFPYNDGGYNIVVVTAYNDAGYDRTATLPFNDAGYDLTALFPYNDGGYSISVTTQYNDAGYTVRTITPYNDGGYSVVVSLPYNDGGYCDVVPYNDGGIVFTDGGRLDQLALANGVYDQPSRTVIDRNGNVWAVLRATDGTNFYQSGVTKIVNVDDHLAECTPRCHTRRLLKPNQAFTEGVPLNLAAGGTVTLTPPTVIAAGPPYAVTYACLDPGHDATGTIETDAVNYDDCLSFSIPLGAPYPDPNTDPSGLTNGLSFGRGAAISPNCDPGTNDCDVWVGMWNDAGWIRLSYNGGGSGTPFDVGSVIYPGASPYGATVDCAGVIWGTGNNAFGEDVLTATTTVAVNDPVTGISVPAYRVLSNFAVNTPGIGLSYQYGIPKPATNDHYGISSDISERIWSAAGDMGASVSSFNGRELLALVASYQDAGTLSSSLFQTGLNTAWTTYDFSNLAPGPSFVPFANTPAAGTFARGVNVDKNNNVYVGMDVKPWQEGGQGLVAFNPGFPGSVPCILYDGGTCPGVQLNWAYELLDAGSYGGTVGVDIDAQGNPWIGNYGQPQGLAQRFNAGDGGIMAQIPVGSGTYSYSDFTGYALRYITLSRAVYQHALSGCGVSPEFTVWSSLSYTASVPAGTDLQIDVRVSDSLDPTVINASQDYTVCDSVTNPASPSSCPRNPDGSLNLTPFNLPQGYYLIVYVTMSPTICGAQTGLAAAPTLYNLSSGQACAGD